MPIVSPYKAMMNYTTVRACYAKSLSSAFHLFTQCPFCRAHCCPACNVTLRSMQGLLALFYHWGVIRRESRKSTTRIRKSSFYNCPVLQVNYVPGCPMGKNDTSGFAAAVAGLWPRGEMVCANHCVGDVTKSVCKMCDILAVVSNTRVCCGVC